MGTEVCLYRSFIHAIFSSCTNNSILSLRTKVKDTLKLHSTQIQKVHRPTVFILITQTTQTDLKQCWKNYWHFYSNFSLVQQTGLDIVPEENLSTTSTTALQHYFPTMLFATLTKYCLCSSQLLSFCYFNPVTRDSMQNTNHLKKTCHVNWQHVRQGSYYRLEMTNRRKTTWMIS